MSESNGNGIGGAALAAAFVGAVFVWSGLRGRSVSTSIRSLLSGNNPGDTPQDQGIGSSTGIDTTVGTGLPTDAGYASQLGFVPSQGEAIVAYAAAQLGKPYVFATSGPNTFDCSGLTAAAYQSVGISIPHNSLLQWNTCTRVPEADLQPGDIIFYYALVSHCAIYAGNGQLIEASEPGVPIHQIPVYNNTRNPIKGYGRYTK